MTFEFAMDLFGWIYAAAIIVFLALYVIDYARNDPEPEDYRTPGKTYVSCMWISLSGLAGALGVKNLWETINFNPVIAIIIEFALLIFFTLFVCRVLHLLRIVMDGRKSGDSGQLNIPKEE